MGRQPPRLGVMRLLVSVLDAGEAEDAVAGGADIVDVKNPGEGALGAPVPSVIERVRAAVPDGLPISVAIGDMPNLPGTAALAALGAAGCGARYVKVGLWGPRTEAEAFELLCQVQGAISRCAGVSLVAAAYADAERLPDPPISPMALARVARAAGADGCLIDTAVKDGRGLFDWLPPDAVATLVTEAHRAGLWVALAGSLRLADVPVIRAAGADIVGVRSAACRGGRRAGPLDAALVSGLRTAVHH